MQMRASLHRKVQLQCPVFDFAIVLLLSCQYGDEMVMRKVSEAVFYFESDPKSGFTYSCTTQTSSTMVRKQRQ